MPLPSAPSRRRSTRGSAPPPVPVLAAQSKPQTPALADERIGNRDVKASENEDSASALPDAAQKSGRRPPMQTLEEKPREAEDITSRSEQAAETCVPSPDDAQGSELSVAIERGTSFSENDSKIKDNVYEDSHIHAPDSKNDVTQRKSLFGSWGKTMRSLVGGHQGSDETATAVDYEQNGGEVQGLTPGSYPVDTDPAVAPTFKPTQQSNSPADNAVQGVGEEEHHNSYEDPGGAESDFVANERKIEMSGAGAIPGTMTHGAGDPYEQAVEPIPGTMAHGYGQSELEEPIAAPPAIPEDTSAPHESTEADIAENDFGGSTPQEVYDERPGAEPSGYGLLDSAGPNTTLHEDTSTTSVVESPDAQEQSVDEGQQAEKDAIADTPREEDPLTHAGVGGIETHNSHEMPIVSSTGPPALEEPPSLVPISPNSTNMPSNNIHPQISTPHETLHEAIERLQYPQEQPQELPQHDDQVTLPAIVAGAMESGGGVNQLGGQEQTYPHDTETSPPAPTLLNADAYIPEEYQHQYEHQGVEQKQEIDVAGESYRYNSSGASSPLVDFPDDRSELGTQADQDTTLESVAPPPNSSSETTQAEHVNEKNQHIESDQNVGELQQPTLSGAAMVGDDIPPPPERQQHEHEYEQDIPHHSDSHGGYYAAGDGIAHHEHRGRDLAQEAGGYEQEPQWATEQQPEPEPYHANSGQEAVSGQNLGHGGEDTGMGPVATEDAEATEQQQLVSEGEWFGHNRLAAQDSGTGFQGNSYEYQQDAYNASQYTCGGNYADAGGEPETQEQPSGPLSTNGYGRESGVAAPRPPAIATTWGGDPADYTVPRYEEPYYNNSNHYYVRPSADATQIQDSYSAEAPGYLDIREEASGPANSSIGSESQPYATPLASLGVGSPPSDFQDSRSHVEDDEGGQGGSDEYHSQAEDNASGYELEDEHTTTVQGEDDLFDDDDGESDSGQVESVDDEVLEGEVPTVESEVGDQYDSANQEDSIIEQVIATEERLPEAEERPRTALPTSVDEQDIQENPVGNDVPTHSEQFVNLEPPHWEEKQAVSTPTAPVTLGASPLLIDKPAVDDGSEYKMDVSTPTPTNAKAPPTPQSGPSTPSRGLANSRHNPERPQTPPEQIVPGAGQEADNDEYDPYSYMPRDVTNIPWHARDDSTPQSLRSQSTLSSSPFSTPSTHRHTGSGQQNPHGSRPHQHHNQFQYGGDIHDPAIVDNSPGPAAHAHHGMLITTTGGRPRRDSQLADFENQLRYDTKAVAAQWQRRESDERHKVQYDGAATPPTARPRTRTASNASSLGTPPPPPPATVPAPTPGSGGGGSLFQKMRSIFEQQGQTGAGSPTQLTGGGTAVGGTMPWSGKGNPIRSRPLSGAFVPTRRAARNVPGLEDGFQPGEKIVTDYGIRDRDVGMRLKDVTAGEKSSLLGITDEQDDEEDGRLRMA